MAEQFPGWCETGSQPEGSWVEVTDSSKDCADCAGIEFLGAVGQFKVYCDTSLMDAYEIAMCAQGSATLAPRYPSYSSAYTDAYADAVQLCSQQHPDREVTGIQVEDVLFATGFYNMHHARQLRLVAYSYSGNL